MIEITQDQGLCLVTLNRPDKANALTGDMLVALAQAVEDNRAARCIVLTGRGKVYSAGADLEAARAGLATSPLWERLSGALAAHPGLTVAALNGTVAGGALGMVLACDLRIAVPTAKIFYPVMKLGFLPQPSDPARLRALVGPARAKRILMAGEKISAAEAHVWGLIDHLEDDPVALARSLAADTLAATASHAAAIKAMVDAG